MEKNHKVEVKFQIPIRSISLPFFVQVEGWQCDLCGFTTAHREKLSNHLSSQHARSDVQKTKIKTQVLKDVENTCRVTKMTSILKQPTKNHELIVMPKQENENGRDYSAKLSPGSSKQPNIHLQQGPNSTPRAFSSKPTNVKVFQNIRHTGNISSQELTNKNLRSDKMAGSSVGPAVVDLGGAKVTNVKLVRLSEKQTASVAPFLSKASVAPMLAKANPAPVEAKANTSPIATKANVAPMLAKRFQPIISFAGSLFTADASPELIDTVMVNEQESYGITRLQDSRIGGKLKIEPSSLTTNEKEQDMFWCGICGNMFEREETLMMHVKTHQLPMSWTKN